MVKQRILTPCSGVQFSAEPPPGFQVNRSLLKLPQNKQSNDWLTAKGFLVYDPKRQNFRKDHKSKTLLLELRMGDADLYYQSLLEKKFGTWYKLQRPMFGMHVTVVRGDEYHKVNKDLWGHTSPNQEFEIEYNPTLIKKTWQFWSIPVRSKTLENIRSTLGLSAFHDFHVTIAREFEHLKLQVRSFPSGACISP